MVANEYARALFELARDSRKIEIVNEQFESFIKALDENRDYLKVLTYPHIDLKQKKNSLKSVLNSFDLDFVNFLQVVLDHNRFKIIDEIYESYQNYVLDYYHIVQVVVYTPSALNDKQRASLKESLTSYFKGYEVSLTIKIDESLIGGIKVLANGKVLDITILNKLYRLRATI